MSTINLNLMTGWLLELWDVIVQDTHILAQMFAAAIDGLMNGCTDLFSLYGFG
jgi:hypothetical protein